MRSCPNTGLTIPECSCPRCLEAQLRRFQPAVLEDSSSSRRLRRPRRRRATRRLAA